MAGRYTSPRPSPSIMFPISGLSVPLVVGRRCPHRAAPRIGGAFWNWPTPHRAALRTASSDQRPVLRARPPRPTPFGLRRPSDSGDGAFDRAKRCLTPSPRRAQRSELLFPLRVLRGLGVRLHPFGTFPRARKRCRRSALPPQSIFPSAPLPIPLTNIPLTSLLRPGGKSGEWRSGE